MSIKMCRRHAGRKKADVFALTGLVGHAWGEEEALLGRGGCCQSALVVWKNGDHEWRHVTLDLLNRERQRSHRSLTHPDSNAHILTSHTFVEYLHLIPTHGTLALQRSHRACIRGACRMSKSYPLCLLSVTVLYKSTQEILLYKEMVFCVRLTFLTKPNHETLGNLICCVVCNVDCSEWPRGFLFHYSGEKDLFFKCQLCLRLLRKLVEMKESYKANIFLFSRPTGEILVLR